MLDLDQEETNAVIASMGAEEQNERHEARVATALCAIIVLIVLAAIWFFARAVVLRDREATRANEVMRRVDARLMETDTTYRACRKATNAIFAVDEETAK